jgi:hypothetical protein
MPHHHSRSAHPNLVSDHARPVTNHRHHAEGLNRIALAATLHCLTGCAIGEVAGMAIGTALGWSTVQTVALAVALACLSGFALTALPFLRRGYRVGAALRIALAADTASIAVMELIDNTLMLAIPGAMDAGIDSAFFWGAMAVSLAAAAVAAFPVNRWLIARGQGHALAHDHH